MRLTTSATRIVSATGDERRADRELRRHVCVDGEPAHEGVAEREHECAASANTRPIVFTCSGRPVSLASSTPPPTIRTAPSDDAGDERLAEQHARRR